MKIVISSLHFAWQTQADGLSVATRELRLDGVEMSWDESFRYPHCTWADLETLAAQPRHGEVMLSAHIWDDVTATDLEAARLSLLRWLEICRKTGTADLVIHGGAWPDQRDGIRRVRRVFETVLPAFERAGVTLNLENHYAYTYRACHELFSEPWEFLEVLTLNSPALRFCLDTGHANMTRNTAALLDALAPWLNYVHLADNQGVDDDHAAYGQGTVDWPNVFSRLQGIGYDRVLCVEFPVGKERAPFDACVAEIRQRWPAGRR
jgi:sugar phosphate isomerase/epimerase